MSILIAILDKTVEYLFTKEGFAAGDGRLENELVNSFVQALNDRETICGQDPRAAVETALRTVV